MILMGVKIKKNINAMTIGAIILPSNSPNFIHILFKGFSKSFFKKVIDKKIIDKNRAQTFIVSPLNKGQRAIKIKMIKNKIPKLFSEDCFINLLSKYTYLDFHYVKQMNNDQKK